MSSTTTNKSSVQQSNTRAMPAKSIKIKLKVPTEILAKFPHQKTITKASEASSPAATPNAPSPLNEIKEADKVEVNGDKANEKKGAPVKAGVKRDAATANAASNGASNVKPKARPAPKRRKLDAEDQQPWTVTATGPGAHKLGPKANQGAINAGLRALDRSGKACRKWGKKTFSIRTFNGAEWTLNHWTAPPKQTIKADGEENHTPSTNSDNQLPSSNVPSVASHQPGETKEVSMSAASPPVVTASA